MYLSQFTIRNFRQFGEGLAELQITFQEGVTALVGRNDTGKSSVIDEIQYALLTRDQEIIRVQREDSHIDGAGKQASEIYIGCKLGLPQRRRKRGFRRVSFKGRLTLGLSRCRLLWEATRICSYCRVIETRL